MSVLPGEAESGPPIARCSYLSPIYIVFISRPDCCRAVDQLTSTVQVVLRIGEVVGSLLLALREEPLRHRSARRIAFFAEFQIAPEEARVTSRDRVVLLDDADTAAETVVAELTAVGAVVNREKSILGIPFECSS